MFTNLVGAGLGKEQIILIVLLAVMVVVLIVLPMFTNKRRNKAVNELYSSIRPGDVIKTVGGIIGEVKEVKEITPVDKQMVIETGLEGKKTTMVFDIQAVYQVISKVDAPAPVVTDPVAEPVETVVDTKSEPESEPFVEETTATAPESEMAAVDAEPVAEEKKEETAKAKKPTSKTKK